MGTRSALTLLLVCLCACKPAEDSHAKAIIGAVLIDGAGGPPLTNSVVVVGDGRILQAGRHGEIPLSAQTSNIDGGGKYLVPAVVDVFPNADPAYSFAAQGAPATADEARTRIAALSPRKPAAIHVWPAGMPAPILRALLEAARGAAIPIVGHPISQADAEALVEDGASSLVGMIRDTEALDADFVNRLRDLRLVYAPALSAIPPGAELERARHNAYRLFAAGVPLAVASGGGDAVHECELLADAGVPPLDVIVAATSNGARALHQDDERGAIQPGKRADLLLLPANPGEDIRNLRRVDRRMTAGEWSR
ncbi:MAG TPA: amidohydrolase family protein [Candidatus Sulfopaludibacter sp.]|nr:amidohydrolase family protein [Candidatus Sulfopaludibacter sp.]